jgi:hypothetical protein
MEIRTSGCRIDLGTFETAHEAPCAYGTAAWRLDRPHAFINFDDVQTVE